MGRDLLASSDLAALAAAGAESELARSATGAVIVLHQEER